MSMLEHALEYASKGWAVFPCAPRDKRPATKHGCKDATTDPETIRAWWGENPEYNVAIATGEPSKLVVIDVDVSDEKEGDRHIVELVRENGPIDYVAHCETGTGGAHYYLPHPGHRVPNSASRLAPGIDVRGEGGYVIAPPSVHPNGKRYSWIK